jgi:hypothetical protein
MNFYKRYIYKNGKKLGPYYYNSKKVDGKVISTYLGTKPPSKFKQLNFSKKTLTLSAIILSVVIAILIINLIFNLQIFSTGNIPLSNSNEIPISEENSTITPTVIINETNQTNVSLEQAPGVPTEPITADTPIIKTVQGQAAINQPVLWTREVQLKNPGKVTIQLPKEAENIVVYKIEFDKKEKVNNQQLSVTAKVSSQIDINNIGTNPILSFFKKIMQFLTGKTITIQEGQEIKEVVINENSNKYIVEYETPPPTITEQESGNEKTIKLSSLGNINYENVLIFTNIPETLNIKNPENIKVFWVDQNKYIQPELIEDKNSNGIYDYIEFIAPFSNNQTFEIIAITKAEHLDENKTFISDIYPQVKDLDNLWSETISDGNYVRVVFEQKLNSSNDITIYPRVVSGNPNIEIYEVNSSEKIAEFLNITSNEYNKVLLTNLQEEQDTFDLKILGGSVEFDHIVDPLAFPRGPINLIPQVCNSEDSLAAGSFTQTCNGVYPGNCASAGDRVSCNDAISESHTSNANTLYGGIRIQTYNSSVIDCATISRVFVCYERWPSALTIANCDISVDANGGASYTVVNSTCPTSTTANPGVICNNVTSLESWSCNNFFGPSGTRALIKSEFRRTSGTRTMNWDVLFFNVTYTTSNQPPIINSIGPISPANPVESDVSPVIFPAQVSDPNGYTDITSIIVNASMIGETTKNGVCNFRNSVNTTTANYTCVISMQYYDKAGVWNVNLTATDSQGAKASNNLQNFIYQELKAITVIQPIGALSWPALSTSASNQLSNNDPTIINNTGNYVGNISITAYNLVGQARSSEFINANNFRAGPTSGLECAAAQLQNSVAVNTGSLLNRGQSAIANVYYCIPSVPSVSSQAYSATGASSWIISI